MEFHKTEKPLRGEITIPGDKSISHRSVMFGAISQGNNRNHKFSSGTGLSVNYFLFPKNGD